MAKETVLHVTANGLVQFIWNDELSVLLEEGPAEVRRVSHVEFDASTQGWTADLSPVNGPTLGPFPTRQDALAAEVEWLRANDF